MFSLAKKLNRKKKMHFAPKAPPQGIANASGRPTQRRHLGSNGQTEITSSKGFADGFFGCWYVGVF